MSIFKETFKDFVFRQLRMRESIVQTGNDGGTRFGNPRTQIQVGPNFENINIAKGAFYTNSISKQCVIRMTSGVDTSRFALQMGLDGDGIARNFILEGGILQENGQPKQGFAKDNGAYGDIFTRSESDYDYGIVPMPGIIDANIRTKTAYGSLREAQVNFVCHNRRQLDVLELLYMRPGMPILLEWQWSPYINKIGKIEKNTKNIDFFDTSKNINDLNLEIIKNKEDSDGNYDGFIGFCKNFEIVSRPDGGFDCVTEIIAAGEVLEGLKTRNDGFSKKEESDDVPLDNMQFILEGFLELSEIYSNKKFIATAEANNAFKKELSPLAFEILNNDIKISKEDIDNIKDISKGNQNNHFTKTAPPPNTGKNKQKFKNYQKTKEKLDDYFKSVENFFLFKGEKIREKRVYGGADFSNFPQIRDKIAYENYSSKDTFVRWDYFCDKMNEYIFPLYNPKDTKNTLLKWSYTKPVKGKYDITVNANKELENEEYIPLTRYKVPANSIVSKVNNRNLTDGKGIYLDVSNIDRGTYNDDIHREINVEDTLNNSFDPKVCLLPRQTNKNRIRQDIANSYHFFPADDDYIGHIMFNVEYLLKVYNQMAYSQNKPNEDFNLFDYFKKIWSDVNEACLGHHNFTLNVENERTDRIRIIDFKVDPPLITPEDLEKGTLYEFKIQSNESIVRDFNFNTTIPSSLSATIAIASQAPTSVNDLDQVTFKNFNKDIKSRFTTNFEKNKKTGKGETEDKKKVFDKDLDKYFRYVVKLHFNLARVLNGDFYDNGKIDEKLFIETRSLVGAIDNLIPEILIRDPKTGLRKDKIPSALSDIIPLKFNVLMDGISGIVIGNVFKVEKEKLPIGYQGDDVCFIVMGESQTITSGQDWTTELSGMLTLLNLEEVQEDSNIVYEPNLIS